MSIYDELDDIMTKERGEDVAEAIVNSIRLLETYKYPTAGTRGDRITITNDAYGINVKTAIHDALQKLSNAGPYSDVIETLTEPEYRAINHAAMLYGIQDSDKVRILELDDDGFATDMVTVLSNLRDASFFFAAHTTGKYHMEIGKDLVDAELEASMFSGSDSLYSVTIPESITTIDNGCFAYSGLTEIWLPKTLETIEALAFCGTNLGAIDLPKSVTTIGEDAFDECENLTSITLHCDEGDITGSPWGATNATIVWTGGI